MTKKPGRRETVRAFRFYARLISSTYADRNSLFVQGACVYLLVGEVADLDEMNAVVRYALGCCVLESSHRLPFLSPIAHASALRASPAPAHIAHASHSAPTMRASHARRPPRPRNVSSEPPISRTQPSCPPRGRNPRPRRVLRSTPRPTHPKARSASHARCDFRWHERANRRDLVRIIFCQVEKRSHLESPFTNGRAPLTRPRIPYAALAACLSSHSREISRRSSSVQYP